MPSSKACAFPKEMNPPEDFVLVIRNRVLFFFLKTMHYLVLSYTNWMKSGAFCLQQPGRAQRPVF